MSGLRQRYDRHRPRLQLLAPVQAEALPHTHRVETRLVWIGVGEKRHLFFMDYIGRKESKIVGQYCDPASHQKTSLMVSIPPGLINSIEKFVAPDPG